MNLPANRVVAIATAILSLGLAVLPVVGNFDWTSTAGVLAGVIAVLGIAAKWLDGWQKWETNQSIERTTALGALGSGREIPGQTEGVKAEGFTPPPEGDPSLA